jgi:hypothetical protein
MRLRPVAVPPADFRVCDDTLEFWDEKKLGPIPSVEEILAVDLSVKTVADQAKDDDRATLIVALQDKDTPDWGKALIRQNLRS